MTTKTLSIPRATWALIRFQPGYMTLAVLGTASFIILRLGPGLILQRFFDQLTGAATAVTSLWTLLALLVGVELVRMIANISGAWSEAVVRNNNAVLLRHNIIDNSLRRPGALDLPVAPGDIIVRLDDDAGDFADFPTWLPELVGHTCFTVIAFVIMFRINPTITLVAALPLLGVAILNRFAWQRFLHYVRQSRQSDSAVTGFLGELFGAVQAVKVADAEEDAMHYFDKLNEARRRDNVRLGVFYALFQSASDNLGDIAVAIMVLLAAQAIQAGTFTVGDFSLFTTFLFFAARFPATIGSFVSEVAQQRVVLDRMQAIQPDAEPASLVAPVDLSADGLWRDRNQKQLRGVTRRTHGVTRRKAEKNRNTYRDCRTIARTAHQGADLPVPDGQWVSGRHCRHRSDAGARVVYGHYRANRVGQDDAAAGLAGLAAGAGGGGVLERPSRHQPRHLFRPAPGRLYAPGSPPLQPIAAGQHPAGAAGNEVRPGPGTASGRFGRRHRHPGKRPGDDCGAARGAAVGRAGAAHGGRPHVRAPAAAPGLRRPLQRPGRGDGANAVGTPLCRIG
jgi:hypothetical protein